MWFLIPVGCRPLIIMQVCENLLGLCLFHLQCFGAHLSAMALTSALFCVPVTSRLLAGQLFPDDNMCIWDCCMRLCTNMGAIVVHW